MDIRRYVGREVRRLRVERGLSQEDLADASGLHRTYISAIERGLKNATLDSLERLAKALKAAPADFPPRK